jgi:HEPN domain-containing protein
LDIIESSGVIIPEIVKSADILTQFAVQTHYPGPVEEITSEEYEEALSLASKVLFWADNLIAGR